MAYDIGTILEVTSELIGAGYVVFSRISKKRADNYIVNQLRKVTSKFLENENPTSRDKHYFKEDISALLD